MSKSIWVGDRDADAPSREQRAAMLLQVRCSIPGGAFFNIRVRNLSCHGLGGLCMQKVEARESEAVTIAFRNVSPVGARVMWFNGEEIGIRFDCPIDLDRIAEARAWTGPDFSVQRNHEIAERCYRPGFGK